MRATRLFFVGGAISYRALFGWLSPWIYVPSLLVAPIFQILLFAYVGRAAHLRSDSFYVIGNALQYASIPCLFAMSQTITGERWSNTLAAVLASPAPRLPLFLGRALPVVVNGALVSGFALAAGSILLGVHVPVAALPGLVLAVAAAAFSCTGLGLVNASIGLRIREIAVLSNILFGFLLVFCGVNVPLDVLPGWMSAVAKVLPLTHAIQAARRVVEGASLGDVSSLLAAEIVIGLAYAAAGVALLRFFERSSRRHATLGQA